MWQNQVKSPLKLCMSHTDDNTDAVRIMVTGTLSVSVPCGPGIIILSVNGVALAGVVWS